MTPSETPGTMALVDPRDAERYPTVTAPRTSGRFMAYEGLRRVWAVAFGVADWSPHAGT